MKKSVKILKVIVFLVIIGSCVAIGAWSISSWRCLDGCYNMLKILADDFGLKMEPLKGLYDRCVLTC